MGTWRRFLPHACLALSLVALGRLEPTLFQALLQTLADVYFSVVVFVAFTLALFYGIERRWSGALSNALKKGSALEVPIAALLGAFPGCGGAIIVVTQYVSGGVSFGALVAVLIATMGDAAFLLLARDPAVAALVFGVSFCSGVVVGFLATLIHRKPRPVQRMKSSRDQERESEELSTVFQQVFFVLLVPGVPIGLASAFQLDVPAGLAQWLHFDPVLAIGSVGTLLCVAIWLSQPLDSWAARIRRCAGSSATRELVVAETSFVTVWVAVGFLSFETLMYFTPVDLAGLFAGLGAGGVLMATLIGFIPGCGPQILVTTLYLNGVVPFSALLANAISNDGDALFPALALAPRAAILATLCSAAPALLIGYLVYFWKG